MGPVSQQPSRLAYLPSSQLDKADDGTLALALIAGDLHASRIAWTRFSPMVTRMLRRAFGPAHDVDDMVQDVFLCLHRKVGGLREPRSLKAFVISVTAMTIRYELRQRRVKKWLHFAGAPGDFEGAGAGASVE